MNKAQLKRGARDPLAFFLNLVVPSAHGVARFEDIIADHQLNWFRTVAPALLAVAAGKKPKIGRFWVERTKGGSKDSDCGCCLIWLLLFSPNKLDIAVGASDRDQAGELKKAIADILRLNPILNEELAVQSWSVVCRATGSECTILASDVAGSHGSRPDIVVMNELSHVMKEEFATNLLDNATKKPRGIVIVATNAGFLGTWQAKWREIARTSDRWDFHAFSEPAPWLSEAEIEEAQQRNTKARFQRLFYGQWVPQSGDALDDEDVKAAINPNLKPGELRDKDFYVAGLDLGIKHDHSAFVVIAGNHASLQLRLAHAQSWAPGPDGKVNLMAIEEAIYHCHKRYRFKHVGFDTYQAMLMAQRLQARGVPMQEMTFTGANLNTMATTLLEVFRSHRLELYDHPALIKDLGRLTIEEKSYGHRLSAVRNEDGHADLATALAIALPIAVEYGSNRPPFIGAINLDGPNDWMENTYERFLRRQKEYAEEEARVRAMPNSMTFGDALRNGQVRFGP